VTTCATLQALLSAMNTRLDRLERDRAEEKKELEVKIDSMTRNILAAQKAAAKR